jgi:hypothetical protein
MPLSAKKMQELMKEKRRREKLPPKPVLVELMPLTLKPRELNQITEHFSSVLLAIETALVQCAREHSTVDDEVVRLGLACSIRQTPSEAEAVTWVVGSLVALRATLQISEEDWISSMRAICTSVTNHCKRNAGSFSYLTSARLFIDKANGIRSKGF